MDMQIKEINIPVPYGHIATQVFGEITSDNKPLIALHGFKDNSNSFKPIAPFFTKRGYYIIALDYPGHGLSSFCPPGVPYTPYNLIIDIRRVVNHFDVKRFTFLAHSFGGMMSLMYTVTFPEQVEAILALDTLTVLDVTDKKVNINYFWNKTIDLLIDFEDNLENRTEKPIELTRELALKILLKANHSIDEKAGLTLLERGLVTKNNKLDFSRDEKLKYFNFLPDFHLTYFMLKDHVKCPFLLIYAHPFYLGLDGFKMQQKLVKNIKKNNPNKVELVKIKGTHHFHMIQPEKTANIILDFLNNIQPKKPTSKL